MANIATFQGTTHFYNNQVASPSYFQVQLLVDLNSQSVANNTSNVTLTQQARSVNATYWSYGMLQTSTIQGVGLAAATYDTRAINTWQTFGSRTFDVSHNADGTFTLSASASFTTNDSAGNYVLKDGAVGGSVALTTIARASQPTLDAASKDFGGTFTIYTNWASSGFTHNLYYAFGAIGNTLIASGVGASTTWIVPTSLGSQISAAMSGSGTITCDTYSGATYIGTKTVAFTLTVPSSWRAVLTTAHSGFSWTNSPAQLTGYTIQNISTLTLTLVSGLNSLVSSYGTSITAYQVRFDTYNGGEITYSDAAISRSAGLITVSGTQYAYYKVKDARGNWSNEVSKQIMGTGSTIYAYTAPTNNGFNVARNATVLTTADFIMNFAATSLNNANTWTYQRQYYNGSSWINIDASPFAISGYTITSTLTHSLPYSEASIYQLRVVLIDKFNTVYYTNTLPTSDVPFVLTQFGAGIGKIPTGGGAYDLEVGAQGIRSDGPISGIVDRMMWKNYANHMIFDASASTSPTGSAVNANNAINAWVSTYPTLMGWNGTSTYGVRVDSARVADSVLINAIYPVGSIYMSVSATNPGSFFGGTWVTFANGRTLVGVFGSDTDFNTAEKYGGAKTHTLALTEIPSHNHLQASVDYYAATSGSNLIAGHVLAGYPNNGTGTTYSGGGGAHNNMPPYMVVYMWKRTA